MAKNEKNVRFSGVFSPVLQNQIAEIKKKLQVSTIEIIRKAVSILTILMRESGEDICITVTNKKTGVSKEIYLI